MAHDQPLLARVRDVLREKGPGARFCSAEIAERFPDVERTKITNAVCMLAHDSYDMLARSERVGGRQFYRVKDTINRPIGKRTKRTSKVDQTKAEPTPTPAKAKPKQSSDKPASQMQVLREALQAKGVGAEVRSDQLVEELPNIDPKLVTMYLSQFRHIEGAVEVVRTEGRRNVYRVTEAIFERARRQPGAGEDAKAKAAKAAKPRKKDDPNHVPAVDQVTPDYPRDLRRKDGPAPLDPDDDRPLSRKVLEILRGYGVGTIVKTSDVAERIPGTTPRKVGWSLAQLASGDEPAVVRAGKKGVRTKFRIERAALDYKRNTSPASAEDREPPPDAEDRGGEDSTMGQVHAMLRELGPGVVVTMDDIAQRAKWLKRNDVSAALAMLSYPQYGVTTRLEKQGRTRRYRIEKAVYKDIRHGKRPKWTAKTRGGEDAQGASISWIDEQQRLIDERRRLHCSDLLLEAAEAVEDGDTDRVLRLLRRVYKQVTTGKKKKPTAVAQ